MVPQDGESLELKLILSVAQGLNQEGGGVSRVNIGRLITTSVTSRHTSMFFQNGGQFSCSLFLQKMTIFRRSGKLFRRARMTKHLKNRKE